MKKKNIIAVGLALVVMASVVGCTSEEAAMEESVESADAGEQAPAERGEKPQDGAQMSTDGNQMAGGVGMDMTAVEGSLLDTADMFTDRDLDQTADLEDATYIQLASGSDVSISQEGVYVLSGQVEDVTILVEANDEAKVQLVLDGVTITNDHSPAIYVKSGDKVFITTTDSDNHMEVSGTFEADGDAKLDAAVYSKSDLVLNGVGSLEVVSAKGNGITSKDDLRITGGEYTITSYLDGLEANDSIRIYDGDITIVADKDALHSENDDDDTLGYIYIQNGSLNITSADDAIRGTSAIQIDGGTINIDTCTEGIEGTYLQINGGYIDIYSTDDGINATSKSTAYSVIIEVNGGEINVDMASGDTDGFDSNGNIYINDGTINIETSRSSFDANGTVELNGGTVTVNGQKVTEITQEQMGGKGKTRK